MGKALKMRYGYELRPARRNFIRRGKKNNLKRGWGGGNGYGQKAQYIPLRKYLPILKTLTSASKKAVSRSGCLASPSFNGARSLLIATFKQNNLWKILSLMVS